MGRRRGGRSGNGTMMSGLSQLMIDEASSRVKVSDANGRVIAQYPVTGDTSSNALNSPRTEWKGSQLVATAEGRRGGSITRTFDLSPDGKQLYMTTKIENPRLQAPVAIRFVYDHAAASE